MRSILLLVSMAIISFATAQSNFDFEYNSPLKGTEYIYTLGYPSITTGYINNDKYPDLILGTYYNQYYGGGISLIFIFNPQQNTYIFQDTLRDESGNIIYGYQPSLTDLNFDNVPELFIKPAYPSYSTLFYKYQMTDNGNFTYVDEVKDINGNTLNITSPPCFFDYDNDTLADLYYFYNGTLYLSQNIGDTIFDTPRQVYFNNGSLTLPSYLTRPDFYYYNDSTRLVIPTINQGIFNFAMVNETQFKESEQLKYYPGIPFSGTHPEIIIDSLKGEPILNLLYTQENDIIKHYQNNINYDSGFVYRNILIAEDYFIHAKDASQLCFYDMNNDGKKDLIIVDKQGNILISLDIGDNSAYFSLPDTIQVSGQNLNIGKPASPTVADFDLNGKPDLLLATTNGQILWYEQTSLNQLTYKTTIIADDTTITIAAADIDKDGKPELLLSNQIKGNLIIYQLNGTQLDSIGGIGYIGYRPIISSADINNDTYPDLVFIYQDNIYRLAIWTNDGNGNFSNPNEGYTDIPVGYSRTGLAMYDIDRDNKPDAVIATNTGDLLVYKNKTPSSAYANIVEKINIKIYPNPVSSQIYINTENEKITKLSIYSLKGNLIKNFIVNSTNASINLENLSKGIYILEIHTRSGIIRKRILKI